MDEISREIEKWLGFYFKATLVSVQLPGIADYKHELSSFERDIREFLEKLHGYPEWVGNSIGKHGGNLIGMEENLTALADASATALSTYVKQEGRGRKKDEPRLKVIQELRRIFFKYYTERNRNLSTAKARTERKDAERDFIETALNDADIPVPEEQLARLLRAPEAALSIERAEVRQRISEKADKARTARK